VADDAPLFERVHYFLQAEVNPQLAGHGVDLQKEMDNIGILLLSQEEAGNYLEAMLPMVTPTEDQATAEE